MTGSVYTASNVTPCVFCGSSSARTEIVRETIQYQTPKGSVDLDVDVPYDVCEACGYRGFGSAGERARTSAIYQYLGRLTPWEIITIRRGLGLSQKEFADRLGVGHASLERWETGEIIQNESMDNLLLLLSNEASYRSLVEEKLRRQRHAILANRVSSISQFRALKEVEVQFFSEKAQSFRLRVSGY